MTPELRTQLLIGRLNNYATIMFTTMFVFVGVAVVDGGDVFFHLVVGVFVLGGRGITVWGGSRRWGRGRLHGERHTRHLGKKHVMST